MIKEVNITSQKLMIVKEKLNYGAMFRIKSYISIDILLN